MIQSPNRSTSLPLTILPPRQITATATNRPRWPYRSTDPVWTPMARPVIEQVGPCS